MKKVLLFLSVLTFFSCGGEDDFFEESVLGQWQLESASMVDCEDGIDVAMQTADDEGCTTLKDNMLCLNINFNTDGTGVNTEIIDGITDIENFTFTTDEESNNVIACPEDNDCVTFTLVNDRLEFASSWRNCIINATYVKI